METLLLLGSIFSIHVLAWMTPGPMWALLINNTLSQNRSAGIATAAGISLGNVIHIIFAIILLSTATTLSEYFLEIVRYLGSGYLLYIGIKTLRKNLKMNLT